MKRKLQERWVIRGLYGLVRNYYHWFGFWVQVSEFRAQGSIGIIVCWGIGVPFLEGPLDMVQAFFGFGLWGLGAPGP